MSNNIHSVSKINFQEEVLSSSVPVIVDFWAEWCGPCKVIQPVLEEIYKEYQGKLKIVTVNVDTENELAIEYNVRGVPTLIMFKEGEIISNQVGIISKNQLKEFIEEKLK